MVGGKKSVAYVKIERQMKFIMRFVYLMIAYFVFSIVVILLNVVIPVWHDSLGLSESEAYMYLSSVIDFMGNTSWVIGFVFAELVRRSTVNEKTDDLRPYTWREILSRISHPKLG